MIWVDRNLRELLASKGLSRVPFLNKWEFGQQLLHKFAVFKELPDAVQSFMKVRKLLNILEVVGNLNQISLSA